MATVTVAPFRLHSLVADFVNDGTEVTVNATGESSGVVGKLFLPGGSTAGSKTISAAGGGSIIWRTGSAQTFAAVGSILNIGIQDVSATTGLEDGTYDVQGDLVAGTDTITANTFNQTLMDTGTKTMAHGDIIAIVINFGTRVNPDAVIIRRQTSATTYAAGAVLATGFPYGTADTGALATTSFYPICHIVFDDGTHGWIAGAEFYTAVITSTSFAANSTPDEYVASWTAEVPMRISAVGLGVGAVTTGDTFEIVIYSDPYGTPAIIQTIVMDPEQYAASATRQIAMASCADFTTVAGTTYGVALRPTSNNAIEFQWFALGTGMEELKEQNPFPDIKVGSRSNQTGAFTEVATTHIPFLMVVVTGLDNGAGGGSGSMMRPVSAGGGLV